MFVNFDREFKEEEKESTLPQVLLDYLNKELEPHGLKYINAEKGLCRLVPMTDTIKFSGIAIDPDEKMKKILGENPNFDMVYQYMYNSQREIPVKATEDGYIIINGVKVDPGKIVYNPLKENDKAKTYFFLVPPKMNEKIDLVLSGDGIEKKLNFARIPDNSYDWIVFQSDSNNAVQFILKMNKQQKKMVFNFTYDFSKTSNTEEAIEIATLCKAFVLGRGKINEIHIPPYLNSETKKIISDEQILFWTKISAIEKKLGISINPATKEISNEDVYFGELLYRSLICKTPVMLRENIKTINSKKEPDNIVKDLKKGSSFLFQFQENVTITLLQKHIELRSIKIVFNCLVSDIQEEDEEYKVYITDVDENNKKYVVGLYFIDDEDLENYTKTHELLNEFKKAKPVVDYILVP